VRRAAEHVGVGEAQQPPARGGEAIPLAAVVLEGVTVGVERMAVELDGEAVAVPDGVDLEALDRGVHRWTGEVRVLDQGQKGILEEGARDGRAVRGELVEGVGQPGVAGAMAATRALERSLDGRHVQLALTVRLTEGLAQVPRFDQLREVDDRPRDRRHRDAAAGRDVFSVEDAPGVDDDPGDAAARRRGDVAMGGIRRPQAMERSGAAVAQHRSGPRRKHRREPVPFRAQVPMSKGVHTTMESNEHSALDPVRDRVVVHAGLVQLPACQNAMLLRRQSGNHAVRPSTGNLLGSQSSRSPLLGWQAARLGHAAESGGLRVTRGPRFVPMVRSGCAGAQRSIEDMSG
jgi:hypothetical protein